MRIDLDTVRQIARLARLDLTPEEVAEYSGELTAILDYFQDLAAVDVTGVTAAHLLPAPQGRLRDDAPAPADFKAAFLAGAPHAEGDYVKVAPVFGPGDDSPGR